MRYRNKIKKNSEITTVSANQIEKDSEITTVSANQNKKLTLQKLDYIEKKLVQLMRFLIIFLVISLSISGFLFYRSRNSSSVLNNEKLPQTAENENPCRSFELIGGKLEHANVVLLGESHLERERTNNCIDVLTENVEDHVILIESVPLGQEVECEAFNLRNHVNRRCIGWDDPALAKKVETEILEYLTTQALSLVKNIFQHYGFSDKQTDVWLDKQLSSLAELIIQYENKIDRNLYKNHHLMPKNYTVIEKNYLETRLLTNTFTELKKLRANGMTYNKIFKQKQNELQKPMPGVNYTTSYSDLIARQQSYLKALGMFKQRFVIGISGVNHVKNSGHPALDETVQYLRQELENKAEQQPYAILGMKVNPQGLYAGN